jgi:hypothetical protein
MPIDPDLDDLPIDVELEGEALDEPTLEDVEDDLTARPRDHTPDEMAKP